MMLWTWKQRGWRAFLARIALLTSLWLAVVLVFAAEIYLSALGGPLKISWTIAACSAFRDWFPWILLSPATIALAEHFRLSRTNWGSSLIVHLAACFLFTLAYEALIMVVYPQSFIVAAGGIGISTGIGPPPGLHVFREAEAPPPFLPPPTGAAVALDTGSGLHVVTGRVGMSVGSNVISITAGPELSSLPAPLGPPFGVYRRFSGVSRWTQFLNLAVMRTQFTIPIYWCVVCVCWAINHFQESSERERRTVELEARLTDANLQALKMQLQPHFLFNTLNTISSLIHENPKLADDMIGSLSQFLRATLEISSRNQVPLRTELEFVDRYLEIQQTRFGDRLRVQREVDSQLMDALLPPLILQPLVENAIRYGIESHEAGGTITVRAARCGDSLRLEVCDTGAGLRAGRLLAVGNGVGLSNAKARLQELYGDKHLFKLIANQPSGVCVEIEIPLSLPTEEKRKET